MNKKVLHTMIILCWVFLGIYALLKLIPQMASKFVIVVNNERIVEAGKFIDERVWLQQIIYGLTTLLEYVWDLLRGKISTSEMMDKYCVAEKTISQDRWRYKKKFSNPIDSEELK